MIEDVVVERAATVSKKNHMLTQEFSSLRRTDSGHDIGFDIYRSENERKDLGLSVDRESYFLLNYPKGAELAVLSIFISKSDPLSDEEIGEVCQSALLLAESISRKEEKTVFLKCVSENPKVDGIERFGFVKQSQVRWTALIDTMNE